MKRISTIFRVIFYCFALFGVSSFATTFMLDGSDLVGYNYTIVAKRGDTFSKIAVEHDIGIIELKRANPHIGRIRVDDTVIIPKQFILPPTEYRKGIVINMTELRLYRFSSDGNLVMTYPVSMGKVGWRTPSAETSIVNKKEYPTWYVPKSIKEHHLKLTGKELPDFIPPGPKNPLGTRAIYLGIRGYLIHGNNNPSSIGKYVSSGCIRMYNRDVEEVFETVEVGERVTIINHKFKIGVKNGVMYLEAQPKVETNRPSTPLNYIDIEEAIYQHGGGKTFRINWKKVKQVIKQSTGIPEKVSY